MSFDLAVWEGPRPAYVAIYFPIVWSRADEVAEVASRIAAEHGLVCFDPQSEQLLPRPPRRGWRRLLSSGD